jgi:hypothetical protein
MDETLNFGNEAASVELNTAVTNVNAQGILMSKRDKKMEYIAAFLSSTSLSLVSYHSIFVLFLTQELEQ